MPKLNPTKAAEVKKAGEEGSKFVLLPEGLFRVKLTDVASDTAKSGKPMWIWKFETVEFLDGENTPAVIGKEQWYRTVIQDNTLWDLDRVFAAFEAEADTDTDELVGDEIVVMVVQELITGGKRKGQMGNSISDFFTLAEGVAKASASEYEELGSDKAESDEPPF